MNTVDFNTPDPADLIECLRQHPSLAPFRLSIHLPPAGDDRAPDFGPCGAIGPTSLCGSACRKTRQQAFHQAFDGQSPVVFRCPVGLLHFTVPLPEATAHRRCLCAGGLREENPALPQLEKLSNAGGPDRHSLVEQLQQLPCTSLVEVEAAAREAERLLTEMLRRNLHAVTLDKTTRRLETLKALCDEIDRAGDADRTIDLLAEALVVLFDLPRLAVLLTAEGGKGLTVGQALGIELAIDDEQSSALLAACAQREPICLDGKMDEVFPGSDARLATAFPLASAEGPLGMLILFDVRPPARDRLLIELLIDRTTTRLRALLAEARHRRQSARTQRLVNHLGLLSRCDEEEELCRQTLELASDLVEACSGSLMIVDADGTHLGIRTARGMNPALARGMRLEVGRGIAGRVARNGLPLVVNDIEKDERVAAPNRPRFRTKSFISLPLKGKDRTYGVLNLADKASGELFTETDLNLLQPLTDHAGLRLEQIASLEQTSRLEKLSLTDPLTGLFNRRYLEKRLNEEISRSRRHDLQLTLVLLDLDHFKHYNDSCGHLAGDQALQKVAELLRQAGRDMDVVARYGGEEFCVVLPATSKEGSIFVAERMRRAIEKEPFASETKLPLGRLSASLGIASFPEDGDDLGALLEAADVALYAAKKAGRNRLVVFDPSLQRQQNQA